MSEEFKPTEVPHPALTENAKRHYDKSHGPIRPKDASTLIILDREHGQPRILMGRRHQNHRFMPGMFVFPGGRLDLSDRQVPFAKDLDPRVLSKLRFRSKNGSSEARMRGLAICAIRETYEEAGLFLGVKGTDRRLKGGDWEAFKEREIVPDLSPFRFIARAITPPGRTRRFDTRFFAVDACHIIDRLPEGTGPTGELEDLHWLTIDQAHKLKLPRITQEILTELDHRLARDPDFTPELPTPFFYMKGKTMVRTEI